MQEAALNKEEIGFDSMIIGDNHNFPCEKKVVTNLEDESSPSFFFIAIRSSTWTYGVFGWGIWSQHLGWSQNLGREFLNFHVGFIVGICNPKIPA